MTKYEEQDRMGMRSRQGGGEACGRFGLSSGDLPGSSGSAGETVVIDGVNVFLDLEAEVLDTVREEMEISRRGCHSEGRDRLSRVARKREWRTCIHLE